MRTAKTVLCVSLLVLLYGPPVAYHALNAPISLDEKHGLDRIARSPLQTGTDFDYWQAIDHPALSRWVNIAVLKVLGVEITQIPETDASRGGGWNIAHGRVVPRRPVQALRGLNVVLLVGALGAFLVLAHLVYGSCWWGLLLAAPLALSPQLGRAVGGFIITDTCLAFFLAWSLPAWVAFHLSNAPTAPWRVVLMGALLGLAVSSKLNAGLVLFAYLAYLAVLARGFRRVSMPLTAVIAAFAVFVAVNPVMWQGGPPWWGTVLSDVLKHRANVVKGHVSIFGPKSFLELLRFAFPCWWAIPPLTWLVGLARREKWFMPVALWSAFLVFGTALTVNQTIVRYLMPLNLGLTGIVMLSAVTLARRLAAGLIRPRDLLSWGRGAATARA